MTISALQLARSLRAHLDPPTSFHLPYNSASARWLLEVGLGTRVANQLRLTGQESRQARILVLHALESNDFEVLDTNATTRSETLAFSGNEKLLKALPRGKRVAVKAFPCRPLMMDQRELWLTSTDNIEVSLESILRFQKHQIVVAVENWESFERLPLLDALICSCLPLGSSPLAIWRGSVKHPIRAALDGIKTLNLPCYAYVDLDPAGLTIAQSLPGFVDLLAPPKAELEQIFSERGRSTLFINQPMPRMIVPQTALNWHTTFQLCNKFSAGVPQEHF